MFERLTRRLIGQLPSRRRGAEVVRVSAAGLHVRDGGAERVVAWRKVDRVVADRATQMAGDTHLLVFGLAGGGVVVVSEADGVWRQVAADLPEWLPGAERGAAWQVRLAAADGPVEVFQR